MPEELSIDRVCEFPPCRVVFYASTPYLDHELALCPACGNMGPHRP